MSGPAAVAPSRFAEVSAVVPTAPGHFDAQVHPEWTIGGKPNGGYLLAIMGRAAAAATGHHHVLAASAHYLRSPVPGAVDVDVEVLREGRSASQLRARMSQEGATCVEALVTTGRLADTTSSWDRGAPEAGGLPFESCPRLAPRWPDGSRVALLEHAEIRMEPASASFAEGRPTGRGELRGWLALPGGEDFDPSSLLFAVDAFPPATFDIEFTGWVPTFELTAYVRALPAPGAVRVLQRAQLVGDRRVDETCFVWDAAGRLVAQAVQLAAIRLG